ncbi:hypothetical protein, partial [Nocardia sp. NPDC057030]|uniref:hypothetical protein n=1 Tax=Nocardia sp. NPDC057030 TaxID=3346005 RepID=UPI0036410CA0
EFCTVGQFGNSAPPWAFISGDAGSDYQGSLLGGVRGCRCRIGGRSSVCGASSRSVCSLTESLVSGRGNRGAIGCTVGTLTRLYHQGLLCL